MRKSLYVGLLAALLAAGPVFAAEAKPADSKDQSKEPSKDQLQAQLDAAQEKLEAAAREVAELSGKISGPVLNHFFVSGVAPPRSLIGVQLDPESGKDGARVVEVSPGGAAAEAGIRSGDVIVALNGERIADERSARQVTRLMRDIEPRSKVKVRVLREGKPKEFELTAREGVRNFAFATAPAAPFPPDAPDAVDVIRMPAVPLPPPGFDVGPTMRTFMMGFDDGIEGMELATLTPTLGKYFGTDKGVLVVRAPERAPFKLEDGDVILSIGGREPNSVSHATRILRSYQPGEKVDIKLMRQRKPVDLQVTLPERPRDEFRRGAGVRFNADGPT